MTTEHQDQVLDLEMKLRLSEDLRIEAVESGEKLCKSTSVGALWGLFYQKRRALAIKRSIEREKVRWLQQAQTGLILLASLFFKDNPNPNPNPNRNPNGNR